MTLDTYWNSSACKKGSNSWVLLFQSETKSNNYIIYNKQRWCLSIIETWENVAVCSCSRKIKTETPLNDSNLDCSGLSFNFLQCQRLSGGQRRHLHLPRAAAGRCQHVVGEEAGEGAAAAGRGRSGLGTWRRRPNPKARETTGRSGRAGRHQSRVLEVGAGARASVEEAAEASQVAVVRLALRGNASAKTETSLTYKAQL